ncbi:hypothetical protein F5Y14DRAFT_191022 [Nemania sp. NC0429]|nr:hypothetical protein F5Y14DRAFT_191022 [Nemania sp. NC0429]
MRLTPAATFIMATAAISNWPGPRAVRTCTECKQSKLRCDSKERFPNPCTRCQLRDLQCVVDPSFRRTPARKRMEAMSKELNELRSQGLKTRGTSTTSTDDSSFSTDAATHGLSAIPEDNFELSVEAVAIGCTVVSSATAIEAFKIFASLFHHKFPILISININNIYNSSPLLFWTIIAIVSSHTTVPSAERLFDQIAGHFHDMVRAEVLQAPLPLQKIQALLLLCVWPMPVDKQHDDPSWLHSGIAVNAALYLGLHRSSPSHPTRRIGGFSGTPLESIVTWLGCFYVSGSLSMHFGLPVIVDNSSELSRVSACLQEYPISREFAGEIKLQAIIADFTNVLSHSANDGAIDSSILNLLDRELENLRSSYPDQWPRMLEYNTLVAKLYTYGFVISRDRTGRTAREILLKLSFSTCLRIIYLANLKQGESLPEIHGVPPRLQRRAQPKGYFRGLAFTTAFLLRYFSLNTTASAEEQQLAANHVVLSHSIFKACSNHPTDEQNRVAVAFEELCQHGPMAIDAPRMAPGERVGVSILLTAMRSATAKLSTATTSNAEMPAPSTSQSVSPDPNLIPHEAYGTPMNQTLDAWPIDMLFTSQGWDDPAWDVLNLNLPFMEAPFQPRHNE